MRQSLGSTSKPPSPGWPVGEALVKADGRKGPPKRDRARVCCPRQPARAHHAPAAPGAHRAIAGGRDLRKVVDRESAYEKLKGRTEDGSASPAATGATARHNWRQRQRRRRTAGQPERRAVWLHRPAWWRRDGLAQTMAKSAVRTMGTTLGKEILRGAGQHLWGSIGGADFKSWQPTNRAVCQRRRRLVWFSPQYAATRCMTSV